MKTYSFIKDERGFTLIEIIAVLIILGILAAVAVPRYFDISNEAQKRAFQGALAEGLSLCSIAYGKAALAKGGAPSIENVIAALANKNGYTGNVVISADGTGSNPNTAPTIAGDFNLTFVPDTTNKLITITASHHTSAKDPDGGWDKNVDKIDAKGRVATWNMPK